MMSMQNCGRHKVGRNSAGARYNILNVDWIVLGGSGAAAAVAVPAHQHLQTLAGAHGCWSRGSYITIHGPRPPQCALIEAATPNLAPVVLSISLPTTDIIPLQDTRKCDLPNCLRRSIVCGLAAHAR